MRPQFVQATGHLHGIFLENGLHLTSGGDEADHDVSLVGKDGTSSTLSTNDVDVMLAAEVQIDLLMRHLIAAHHYCAAQLPGEKITGGRQMAGYPFLGSEVEGSTSPQRDGLPAARIITSAGGDRFAGDLDIAGWEMHSAQVSCGKLNTIP